MWPYRKKGRKYSQPGGKPVHVIHAWPFSRVHAAVWLNSDHNGNSIPKISIRKKVKMGKNRYEYKSTFDAADIGQVAMCAIKTHRWLRSGAQLRIKVK